MTETVADWSVSGVLLLLLLKLSRLIGRDLIDRLQLSGKYWRCNGRYRGWIGRAKVHGLHIKGAEGVSESGTEYCVRIGIERTIWIDSHIRCWSRGGPGQRMVVRMEMMHDGMVTVMVIVSGLGLRLTGKLVLECRLVGYFGRRGGGSGGGWRRGFDQMP